MTSGRDDLKAMPAGAEKGGGMRTGVPPSTDLTRLRSKVAAELGEEDGGGVEEDLKALLQSRLYQPRRGGHNSPPASPPNSEGGGQMHARHVEL